MEFDIDRQAGATLITPNARTLEAANSHAFKKDIDALLATAQPVVLDLSHIDFIDSSGCGALLHCQRTAQSQGGSIVLCALTTQLQGLLKAIQLDRKIPMYATRAEALAAVGS